MRITQTLLRVSCMEGVRRVREIEKKLMVIDIDYNPTGKEFVTSSYDRHVRIFPIDYVEGGKSREEYPQNENQT